MPTFHAGFELEPRYEAKVIRASLRYSDDEETVFYHEPSGSMFLLHNWGIKALELLALKPMSVSELYVQLKEERGLPEIGTFYEFVSQLNVAGLVIQV